MKELYGINIVNKQPNADVCFVCGRNNPAGLAMQFYDDGADTVTGSIVMPEQYQGYPEIVHGGVLAAILDEVVGRTAMIEDHHRFMMTVNMTLQYRKPVTVGSHIKAVGKRERLRGRICKASGQILLDDGSIACEAALTLADMPGDIATNARLAALGWAVDVED